MQQREKDKELTDGRILLILITINIFSMSASNAAPYNPEIEMEAWVENVPTPIMAQPCPPQGRCWEWLPPVAQHDNGYLLQEESSNNNARLQNQRKIHREVNSAINQLKEDSKGFIAAARSPSPIIEQIPPRPVKKDVFVSRSWGPGGLPFSVLYMNPHSARANQPSAGMAEVVGTRMGSTADPNAGRAYEGSLAAAATATAAAAAAAAATMPPAKHPNYRVALRNGVASGQPRRQYSIIPQLFISYGWGPLGK